MAFLPKDSAAIEALRRETQAALDAHQAAERRALKNAADAKKAAEQITELLTAIEERERRGESHREDPANRRMLRKQLDQLRKIDRERKAELNHLAKSKRDLEEMIADLESLGQRLPKPPKT